MRTLARACVCVCVCVYVCLCVKQWFKTVLIAEATQLPENSLVLDQTLHYACCNISNHRGHPETSQCRSFRRNGMSVSVQWVRCNIQVSGIMYFNAAAQTLTRAPLPRHGPSGTGTISVLVPPDQDPSVPPAFANGPSSPAPGVRLFH